MATKDGATPRELIAQLIQADAKVTHLLKQPKSVEPEKKETEYQQFMQAVIEREHKRSEIRTRYR